MRNLLLLLTLTLALGCTPEPVAEQEMTSVMTAEMEVAFRATLEKHLAAVAARDMEGLRSTMSPRGDMKLLLPGTEVLYSVDSFMLFHEAWFEDTSWTFETEIVEVAVGDPVGIAIVESMYREPERDGVPYFNRMSISYALERIDGEWYVVKDHASSIEKSTDK